jgi:small-conductance mechanosensitive channel
LLAVVPTILIAWLLARLTSRLVARALRVMAGDHLAESSPLVSGPLRLIGIAVFLLAASLLVFPAFEVIGLHPRTGVSLDTLKKWGFEHGLKVVVIALLGYALVRVTALAVRRFEHQVSQGTTLDALERAKRARTLGSLVNNVATTLISMVAVLMVLNELGINIAPALTGAGIAGLAVGFGAQTLVRDVISGFFLILEDQIRVGDSAMINGTGPSSSATKKAPSTCSRTAQSRRSRTRARTSRTT